METTPGHENIPDKLFYKAAEVCQITDTQPYVLRFWESEFPQLASGKNRSGQRVYRREDIDLVFRIKKLLYQEEYTIAGARKALDGDQATLVDPAPSKSRTSRPARTQEVAESVEPAPPARSSLFGETRPEAPETSGHQAAVEEEARYKQLYEESLTTIASLKIELARSDGQADALRERARMVAARLEASLQS